jgi:hypothetical protein
MMRAVSVAAVWIIAIVAGLTASAGWGYFIWSFDWGHSYRGRGLWLMALTFPISVILPVVVFAVAFILGSLWGLIFREKFFT